MAKIFTKLYIGDTVATSGTRVFKKLTTETPTAGLFDADDNLVASWDTLVNTYGMDIEKDYGEYPNDTTSLHYLKSNNSKLSAGRKLIISNSVTRIGDWAFYNCKFLISIVIPNSVTSIGDFAFCDCWGIKSITIPDSVTTVGEDVFNNCAYLVTATLPGGLTHISRYAFSYCTRLTSITIPDSVTTIGFGAFYWCNNLTDVYYGGTEEQWRSISVDNTVNGNTSLLNATIHYNYTG